MYRNGKGAASSIREDGKPRLLVAIDDVLVTSQTHQPIRTINKNSWDWFDDAEERFASSRYLLCSFRR
jgi:hypothetical protein